MFKEAKDGHCILSPEVQFQGNKDVEQAEHLDQWDQDAGQEDQGCEGNNALFEEQLNPGEEARFIEDRTILHGQERETDRDNVKHQPGEGPCQGAVNAVGLGPEQHRIAAHATRCRPCRHRRDFVDQVTFMAGHSMHLVINPSECVNSDSR